MSGSPLVSIIIPVYNGSDYLADAIDSALAQTYSKIEIIIVDDGSIDGGATAAIAARYGQRIRYVHQENGGVAAALNRGIAEMRGAYFSWLSHDDIYLPDKVERQVNIARTFGGPCVVIGSFQHMAPDGTPSWEYSPRLINLGGRPLDAIFHSAINGCALLIAREAFSICGQFDTGLPTTQDYDLWFRMAHRVPFLHCPHVGVRQRIHPNQGSQQSGHLDEVERMFIACIEQTPLARMQGYSGSCLQFLAALVPKLMPLRSVLAYLDGRIGKLIPANFRYGVAILSDSTEATIGQVVSGVQEHPWAATACVVIDPPGATDTDREATIVQAAADQLDTDWILIQSARRAFCPENLRLALTCAITREAAVLAPTYAAEGGPSGHGLLIRKTAIPGWIVSRQSSSPGTAAPYPYLVRWMYPSPEALNEALRGGASIDYVSRVDRAELVAAITRGWVQNRPRLLLLVQGAGDDPHGHLERLTGILTPHADWLVGTVTGGRICLHRSARSLGGGIVFAMPEDVPDLVDILQRCHIGRVDVLAAPGIETNAAVLLDELGLPYDLTIPDRGALALPELFDEKGGLYQHSWRFGALTGGWSSLLQEASRVIALSCDAAAAVADLAPAREPITALSLVGTNRSIRRVFAPVLHIGDPLRVLAMGAANWEPTRNLFVAAASIAFSRGLPIRFYVLESLGSGGLGLTDVERAAVGDRLLSQDQERTAGIAVAVGGIAPHVAWIPPLPWPTRGQMQSDVFRLALPLATVSLGSMGEHCHGRDFTWLLPSGTNLSAWVAFFLDLHATALLKPPLRDSLEFLPSARPFFPDTYLEPLRAVDPGPGAP